MGIRDATIEKIREEALQNLPRLDRLQEWLKTRRVSGEDERRAFIVEFAGMPKAGKSSAIRTIRHYFSSGSKIRVKEVPGKYDPYRLHTPAEGVSLRTPALLKQNLLDFNSWAGAYALQELLQAGHDNYHDLVLLDRGPWDAGCWLEYVKRHRVENGASSKEVEDIIQFFQCPQWMTRADLHVVMVVDPTTAADREATERLISHQGPVSDTRWMAEMRNIYEGKYPELSKIKSSYCPHVKDASALLLDTTGISDFAVSLDIIKRIFDVLELKLDARDLLTKEEIWTGLQSFVTKTARPTEIHLVERYIPLFVADANRLSSAARLKLRQELKDRFFPITSEVDLFTNRCEAKTIIDDLQSLLTQVQDVEA